MENNSILSLCAIIIALSALIVTVWQGIIMRKHNRLSVTPHIRIDHSYDSGVGMAKYVLKNSGIGPAIIVSLQLKIDGKIFPEQGYSMFKGVFKILDLDYDECLSWFPDLGDAIAANEETPLITCVCSAKSKTKYESIKKAIPRLGFIVKYKSVYGDNFITNYSPD